MLQQAATGGGGLKEMMVGRQEKADGRWRGKTLFQLTNTPLHEGPPNDAYRKKTRRVQESGANEKRERLFK